MYLPLRPEEAEQRREELSAWEEAREKYVAGDFAAADALLGSLCETFPETKLYAVFADRVTPLLNEASALAWNGIWGGTQK